MIRALLLDLGNVLVGFDHSLTLARLEEATGKPAASLRPHVYGPAVRAFELGRLDTDAFFRAAEAAAGLPRVPDAVWIPAWRDIFTRDEAALALLPRLAAGVDPILVSNTNALHWEGVLRVAPELARFFPRRALSFEVGAAKPDPAHFVAALALAGAAPHESVFADDRTENVDAARAMGIDAFRVTGAKDLAGALRARDLLAE
ncbi:MAG TPA: HAD-IA family hydrolase [Thermoanaerobaculia bacterium]|nr:HAD-IA family hydrolase [Thermoanaerobaculia bacterium]